MNFNPQGQHNTCGVFAAVGLNIQIHALGREVLGHFSYSPCMANTLLALCVPSPWIRNPFS